jgi:hypothetical protein
MRFRFSTTHPSQDELDSMPRIPLILQTNGRQVEASALVDSGAMINVMPFELGRQLGLTWNESEANVNLGGIVRGSGGMPVLVSIKLADYEPVDLIFAWTKRNDVPLILGQVDFFMSFKVCFERYNLEFEITPRPK